MSHIPPEAETGGEEAATGEAGEVEPRDADSDESGGERAAGGSHVEEEKTPRRLKTPLFQALHQARYERQARITKIQETTGSKLICFLTGDCAEIGREDTLGFADLLYNLRRNEPIDLLLHSHGGEIDEAEKLITMVHNVAGKAPLRVIVPDCAKSAGALMTLGTNTIVMSDSSELGPIDPQVAWRDASGNVLPHSANTYLEAYELHKEALEKDPSDPLARMMLDKLEPATIELFKNLHMRALKLAEQLLARRMLTDGSWSAVAPELLNTKRWYAHGQVISAAAAKDIGLNIELVDADSDLWREIWQLYCLQRMAITDRQRLFESDWVSLPIDGAA
jgi:ClpP class serine protease